MDSTANSCFQKVIEVLNKVGEAISGSDGKPPDFHC
jgi:hypothetical protein